MEKISREKLLKSLAEIDKEDVKIKYAKGLNLLAIKALIKYLKNNDDPELQERLNEELIKLQIDKNENTDVLHIYNNNLVNPITLYNMYELYKDGVKSSDGSRNIILPKQNVASYYLYLAHNAVQKYSQESNIVKKINNDFNANKEKICYRYFEFLKRKYNLDNLRGIERLKAECYFISELRQAKEIKGNTKYLNLVILKELLSRDGKNIMVESFLELMKKTIDEIINGKNVDSKTLKLVGDIYYYGIKSVSEKEIIKQNKIKARDIYEQVINQNKAGNDTEIYRNLIDIYSDNTTPLYDKEKADKLLEIINKKGINIKGKSQNINNEESCIYICSDLHGEYPAYKAIINQLKETDKLYILGDVIDRGPDGIKILQDVMKRKEKGQVEFLIGNHELMMIQALFLDNTKAKQNWIRNDGNITLEEFEKLNYSDQIKIREFLLDSYVYKNIEVNLQNVHLVHARAIQDENNNSDKTFREMINEGKFDLIEKALWDRAPDDCSYKEIAKKKTITIIGHTPQKFIEYKDGYFNIDCGAGYFMNASLVNLTKGRVKYFSVEYEREKENKKQNQKS